MKKDKKKVVAPKSKSVSVSASANPTKAAPSAKPSNKNSDSKIAPLGDRVLIRPFVEIDLETKTDFGIIIPETVSKERPEQGVVIAVGEGRYYDGELIPMNVKVGDKVIFSKYGFDEVKVGVDELYILKEENILAIIK